MRLGISPASPFSNFGFIICRRDMIIINWCGFYVQHMVEIIRIGLAIAVSSIMMYCDDMVLLKDA